MPGYCRLSSACAHDVVCPQPSGFSPVIHVIGLPAWAAPAKAHTREITPIATIDRKTVGKDKRVGRPFQTAPGGDNPTKVISGEGMTRFRC